MPQSRRLKILYVTPSQITEWLTKKHYAKRVPCITESWGIYHKGFLMGVCTFGIPASHQLCEGVCGKQYSDRVLELNRLVIDDEARRLQPNVASYFVGACLRYIRNSSPDGRIVVSYSDTAMGHIGIIYQATNFLYTGATKERTDIFSGDGKHSRHYDKSIDYSKNRVVRSSKHRYVRLLGSRSQVRKMKESLRYPVVEYPRGSSERYDASYQPVSQICMEL